MTNLCDFMEGEEEPEVKYKKCIKCKQDKPLTSYSNAGGGNYKRTECIACGGKLQRERNKLRKIHGMPPIDYICPLCHRGEDEVGGAGGLTSGTWCIDHNHQTNEFRGWLCHHCNRTLGMFRDDISLLKRAISYLSGETRKE